MGDRILANFKLTAILTNLLIVFSAWSQSGKEISSLKELEWLVGTWQRKGRSGILYENWQKVSNNTFEGGSFTISNGDTTFMEFLRLARFGDDIFYIPKVAHNKYPVSFKLTKGDKNNLVFENTDHDFPQRIIYRLQEEGRLHARIEGTQNGKESGIDFYFNRVD